MKKKTIAIIQCILYLIAPYIALQLCSINRSLVGEFFIIFLILLTISLTVDKPLIGLSLRGNVHSLKNVLYNRNVHFRQF